MTLVGAFRGGSPVRVSMNLQRDVTVGTFEILRDETTKSPVTERARFDQPTHGGAEGSLKIDGNDPPVSGPVAPALWAVDGRSSFCDGGEWKGFAFFLFVQVLVDQVLVDVDL